jgi:dTDP-4-amino-4,6-dideoxygalactose transaminase
LTINIPFHKPYIGSLESVYINQALGQNTLVGDGPWTQKCHQFLENHLSAKPVFITNSCSTALEMAAILLDLSPGDEIIMPSYTFVSTANAFVLHGGTPVFVDIRRDTKNIDETLIVKAITPRTKAIAVMHYGGVACNMMAINAIAKKHGLTVVEDAAQGMGAYYQGKPQGSLSDLGTLSFHGTKNVICGEGGALIVSNPKFAERARIIREKGTDRAKFLRGEVDKYTWVDLGSSYLPSEVSAAFLLAQLENLEFITKSRVDIWNFYHDELKTLEELGQIELPFVPQECSLNGHIFYFTVKDGETRTQILQFLKSQGINAMAHYVPLHTAPGGQKFGHYEGSLQNTDWFDQTIVRLPIWPGLSQEDQVYIVQKVKAFFGL